MKLEMKVFEDKMDSIREDLKRERDKSWKKTTKDVGEVCTLSVYRLIYADLPTARLRT